MAGYIFKIMLKHIHPPVWRRVLMPEKTHFMSYTGGYRLCLTGRMSISTRSVFPHSISRSADATTPGRWVTVTRRERCCSSLSSGRRVSAIPMISVTTLN